MFSSITSYLWGSGEADQQAEDAEAQPAAGSDQVQPLSADKNAAAGVSGQLKTRLTDNEPEEDDDDDWLLVDPASRGNSPQRMETSPLENLLIEHPSMSVYTSRGRPHSTGVESSDSENEDTDGGQPERVVASVRQPPHQGRAVAARVGLVAQGALARSMQVSKQRQETRQMCRNKLQRSNQVLHQASTNRHPRRKHYMLRSSGRSNNRHNYTC